jgi:hypothetical protein
MASEDRAAFIALAKDLDAKLAELAGALNKEQHRASEAQKAVTKALTHGDAESQTPEGQQLHRDVETAQAALYEGTLDLIEQSMQRLLASPPSEDVGSNPYAENPTLLPEDLQRLREWELSNAVARFYRVITIILLQGAVERYLDTCEAYLGYEIGSHDTRRRVAKVLVQISLAAAALLPPPFSTAVGLLPVVQTAIDELRATPQTRHLHEVALTAAGMDKLFILRSTATSLAENMVTLDGTVTEVVDTVLRERQALGELQNRLRPFFEPRG